MTAKPESLIHVAMARILHRAGWFVRRPRSVPELHSVWVPTRGGAVPREVVSIELPRGCGIRIAYTMLPAGTEHECCFSTWNRWVTASRARVVVPA